MSEPVVATEVKAPTQPTVVVSANPAVPGANMIPPVYEDENTGVCRRCRRVFTRPTGINDGNVSYLLL